MQCQQTIINFPPPEQTHMQIHRCTQAAKDSPGKQDITNDFQLKARISIKFHLATVWIRHMTSISETLG